ncbi:peptidase inhibitor family I36 protein [Pendulispora rubella]|uniref:Peptidase inhibitor family I36 protein n=1 Tax=Pendulispora rubella TaxID=2741070 RepID=A0ABZ2KP08_9BACT
MRIPTSALALMAIPATLLTVGLAAPAMADEAGDVIHLYPGLNFTGPSHDVPAVKTSCVNLNVVVKSAENLTASDIHFYRKADCSGDPYVLGSLHANNVPEGFASYIVNFPQ